MFDLIKGCGRSVYASRDAIIYLFNTTRFVGFNPPGQCQYLYFFYSSILQLFVIILSPLIYNVRWIRERDILSATEILFCVQASMNVVGVPIKTIMVLLSLDRLRSIESVLNKLDACYSELQDVAKIQRCAIIGNRIVFGYIVSYMVFATFTLVSPLISGNTPLTLWIPFLDWRRAAWEYWLQVSFDSAILFYTLSFQIVNDSYPAVYIHVIRTHIQLLRSRVRRLGTVPNQSGAETYYDLQQCIKIHQQIFRLLDIVEPVISVTIFVQFLIAAAIISTTILSISVFSDAAKMVASLLYLFCVLLQTAPACYFASHLQADCEKLSISIFHCNWLSQGKRFNNLLIYFLHRSQANLPLTALKMLPIDLATNVSIAKFSFSLFTFIRKMVLDKNVKD